MPHSKNVKEKPSQDQSLHSKEPAINDLIKLMVSVHEEADRKLLEIAKRCKDIVSVK